LFRLFRGAWMAMMAALLLVFGGAFTFIVFVLSLLFSDT
jgi:hypothetical protein